MYEIRNLLDRIYEIERGECSFEKSGIMDLVDKVEILTDEDLTKQFLNTLSIPFTFGYDRNTFNSYIKLEADDYKIHGYSGFLTEFIFDDRGNFIRMGIWE